MPTRFFFVAGAVAVGIAAARADTPSFRIVSLPSVSPSGMSGDASTIFGYRPGGLLADDRAAYWRNGEAAVQGIAATRQSYSTGANLDGTVIVGYYNNNAEATAGAFRSVGGISIDLGRPAGTQTATPVGVSGDGQVIAGWSNTSLGERAFRWTQSDGMQAIAPPSALSRVIPTAMSRDGEFLTGGTSLGGAFRPFRWSQATGYQLLGPIPSNTDVWPIATNLDGSAIVMQGFPSPGPSVELLWTAASGMQSLPKPAGFVRWDPFAMSADGRSIVGNAISASTNMYRAVIWRPELGTIPLSSYLEANGLSLDGWTLEGSLSISDDGQRFFCGGFRGTGPTFERAALHLTIPAPAIAGVVGFLGMATGVRRRCRS